MRRECSGSPASSSTISTSGLRDCSTPRYRTTWPWRTTLWWARRVSCRYGWLGQTHSRQPDSSRTTASKILKPRRPVQRSRQLSSSPATVIFSPSHTPATSRNDVRSSYRNGRRERRSSKVWRPAWARICSRCGPTPFKARSGVAKNGMSPTSLLPDDGLAPADVDLANPRRQRVRTVEIQAVGVVWSPRVVGDQLLDEDLRDDHAADGGPVERETRLAIRRGEPAGHRDRHLPAEVRERVEPAPRLALLAERVEVDRCGARQLQGGEHGDARLGEPGGQLARRVEHQVRVDLALGDVRDEGGGPPRE